MKLRGEDKILNKKLDKPGGWYSGPSWYRLRNINNIFMQIKFFFKICFCLPFTADLFFLALVI
jgi:hypothetical protein